MGLGASVSKSKSVSQQLVQAIQDFQASCPSTPITQKMTGTRITIGGTVDNLNIQQQASISVTCIISQGANWLATQINKQKNTTKAKKAAGILAVNMAAVESGTVSQLTQTIKQKLQSMCGGGSGVTQEQDNLTVDVTSTGKVSNLNLGQIANTNVKCTLDTLAKAHAALTSDVTSDTTAAGGVVQMIIAAIIIIAVLAIGGYIYYKMSSQKGNGGTMKMIEENPELLAA